MKQRGFTLIELLVVIAIIGILASVVLSSLNSAREKAQISRIVSDFIQIEKALELYYSDHGQYPKTMETIDWIYGSHNHRSVCPYWTQYHWQANGTNTGYAPEDVIPGLVPDYLPEFPQNRYQDLAGGYEHPAGSGLISGSNCYMYRSDGIDYVFVNDYMVDRSGTMIPTSVHEKYQRFRDPTRDSGSSLCEVEGVTYAWKIHTPGAKCRN